MANEKEIVLIGAGRIGMGYVADLFDRAGYHLVFVAHRDEKAKQMREQGYYTIFMATNGTVEKRKVSGYEAYSTNSEIDMCIKRLSEINLASVQIYPNGTDDLAKLLAGTVKKRVADGNNDPLDIFFCVNYVKPGVITRERTMALLDTPEEKKYLEERVGLHEALTLRGGYVPTQEMLDEDPLAISATDGPTLPIGENFIGRKPDDVPGVEFIDRPEGRLVDKIWCGNMRHATMAAPGYFMGLQYMHESCASTYVRDLTDRATQEAMFGIAKAYHFTPEELGSAHMLSWEGSTDSTAKDTLSRVLADPKRKLARNDRFTGTGLLCLEQGKLPFNVAKSAAYLFFFDDANDATAPEVQAYIKENGIEKAVEKYCELDLSVQNDSIWHQLVVNHYNDILSMKNDHQVD